MEKDYTIEELREMLKTKEKEEADRKKAEEAVKAQKLAAEKESREKEIKETEQKLTGLYKSYIKDYGSIYITNDSKYYYNFWFLLFKSIWF